GKIELKAFIEQKPLSEISSVFDAVHQQKMQRRAILVPDA
ncbi:MAG: 6-hydroxycyclohex-1-ene-1-carbonyl-CoA dehydrogenase, partial [Deltaproteobacteria bacterium]